jgi:hemerythrin-like domain-containing protein
MPTQAVHAGAQIIHDYIEGFHEGLEEAYVFPPLQQAHRLTDTVTTLLVQHARGRRITADVLRATAPDSRLTTTGTRNLTAALDSFTRMYEVHEAREDTAVFPAFRAITPERTLAELADRFASEQNRQFGQHAFAHIVEQVAAVETNLHIYDLAQFTPQP